MSVRTQFNALDELLEIVPTGGSLTQWYNVIASPQYSPDRRTDNLLLKINLTVTDVDTGTKYTPTISNVTWYYIEGNGSETACSSDTNNYTVSGQNLYVKKNVDPSAAVVIIARVSYYDPRSNELISTEAKVTLTTAQDSSQRYDVLINSSKVMRFDPIAEYDAEDPTYSYATITATAMYGEEKVNDVYFEWYGRDSSITEDTLIDAVDSTTSDASHIPVNVFPCYVSGQGTASLVIDRMLCDELVITCRVRKTSTSPLQPCTDSITVAWQLVPIEAVVYSKNGTTVRSNSTDKTFSVLVNVKGGSTLSDEMVEDLFDIEWWKRKGVMTNSGTQEYTKIGKGLTITLKPEDLKNTFNYEGETIYDSTVLKADIYLRENDVIVVQDNKVVVLGEKIVVLRK